MHNHLATDMCTGMFQNLYNQIELTIEYERMERTCHADGMYSRHEPFVSSSLFEYLEAVESSSTYFEEPLNTIKRTIYFRSPYFFTEIQVSISIL
jgi:hypothetical protein